ncbi:DUF6682 family protein [Ectopseudomonas mendocina]|uniref:DUF6682 family protein n=1 Tax=Ectopseudomonas mendocina TaxID=300 RepID=A0ABZ2RML8_ECTME
MTVTVGDVLRRARTILQERSKDGTRWTNKELLDWLNEAYSVVIGIRPGANTVTAEVTCVAGTRQTIPSGHERLLSVLHNTAQQAKGLVITPILRAELNAMRPRWHGETPSIAIEHYVFEEDEPRIFYVYPPSATGAKVLVSCSAVPTPHAVAQASTDSTEAIRLPDTYGPILLDLVLARAFTKDAEGGANQARANSHLQAAQSALGLKLQGDGAASPNAESAQ